MSMIEPVSAFRRLMAELMNNSTKHPAVYQVGSATGGALSQRLRTASNSNYLILHAAVKYQMPYFMGAFALPREGRKPFLNGS